jgi:hypothetical protein
MDTRIRKPSRFVAPSGSVVVHKGGAPFYVFDSGKPFTFTLPPGKYRIDGGYLLGPMEIRPRERTTPNLRYPLPRRVRMAFGDNPNKASIDLKRGVILCDHSLRALPSFALTFVLFHEIGHYFYQDEESCDEYATDQMLAMGYNPSQVYAAAAFTMNAANGRQCSVQHYAKGRSVRGSALVNFLQKHKGNGG